MISLWMSISNKNRRTNLALIIDIISIYKYKWGVGMEYKLPDSLNHIGLLYKFISLKGEIIRGQDKIKGKNGEKLKADKYVNEEHILHDLIRGIYKPKGFQCMLSYQATEKDKNYGKQIEWKDENKEEFKRIILKPPSSEKDTRKTSDINAAIYAMENKIPIGILLNIDKGINKCLGLGIIVGRNENDDFEIEPLNIQLEELETMFVENNINYYTYRTNEESYVKEILENDVDEMEFSKIPNFYEDTKVGDIVLVVLGGDKPDWKLGLRGICSVSQNPYDRGYNGDKFKYYKIKVKKELILQDSISREQMIPYRDLYNMTFIGPMLKGEPNQLNVRADKIQIYAVTRAILDYYPNLEDELKRILGSEIVLEAKEITNLLLTSNEAKEIKLNGSGVLFSKLDKNILNNIHNSIRKDGFVFEKKFLANFYLSLKTKPFVILAGTSGTGKSKLVRLFAEAIGATKDNERFTMISVKPDWNDSTELLGYKNINEDFVPGKLTKIIYEASMTENKDKPYFICLDEMNLARVEYYLSDYLSLIESREVSDSGEIITDKLFSRDYLGEDYSNLCIPENIYIVGTVNMDDTTFAFSRKVLDRANTIEFSDVDLDALDFSDEECESINVNNSFLRTSFLNIKDALNSDDEFVREINSKVKDINEILELGNKKFGYRVRDEIVFYMLENKINDLLSEDEAFDFQIMQKILPTITGSELIIKDTLIKLFNYCSTNDKEISATGEYIKNCETELKSNRIKYKKSAKKILMMLRGYEDGFTSFWS
jgi:energy-coupling factor transporter ATP-binding protein EcfA2